MQLQNAHAPRGTLHYNTGKSANFSGVAKGSALRNHDAVRSRAPRTVPAGMSAPSEYGFGRVLGEGAFANVLFARRKSDGEDVALKVMLKSHVEREGKTRLVLAEAKALRSCASCAFVVGLHATFQDAEYLFFALEFCASDLLGVIRNARTRNHWVQRCGLDA